MRTLHVQFIRKCLGNFGDNHWILFMKYRVPILFQQNVASGLSHVTDSLHKPSGARVLTDALTPTTAPSKHPLRGLLRAND